MGQSDAFSDGRVAESDEAGDAFLVREQKMYADRRNVRAHAEGTGESRKLERVRRVDEHVALAHGARELMVVDKVWGDDGVHVFGGAAESLLDYRRALSSDLCP